MQQVLISYQRLQIRNKPKNKIEEQALLAKEFDKCTTEQQHAMIASKNIYVEQRAK